ncbi:Ig-like domain-containing protein [Peribacillus sp. NPDC097197]|uniref:PPC domain-containing protein n=1 Tax=Peribacillus sp. NPDC097197 TaxID=3390615 RepID=UPI003D068E46
MKQLYLYKVGLLSIMRIISSTFFILLLSFILNQVAFAEEKILSGVPIQGKIESISEQDVYEFTTDKDGGEIYITLDNTTGTFSMYLYDENGKEVGGTQTYSSGSTITINKYVKKGTYYLYVSPYRWAGISSASYSLKATYASSIKRNTKTFEPNETDETSMPIHSGQVYTSASTSNIDRDMYQFTTDKDGGEIYITLDNTTGTFSMYLYDENGKEVGGTQTYSSGSTITINKYVKKGTYYLAITPYRWAGISSASYRLKATYASSIKRNTKTFEPNETDETSMPVISNKSYKSSSSSPIDRDMYQFTTSKDGEVYITLDNTTGTFSMYLYDENGKEVGGTQTYSSGSTITINKYVKKGTYYLAITPYRWAGISSASYSLKASFNDKTPTVNAISDKSTVITGKAETNATVYAVIGTKQIGKATAKNGAYSIKLNKQKAGTSISVYLVDRRGNVTGSKTVKVIDKTAPSSPTVNTVSNKSVSVSGKSEKGATIKIYNGSKKIGQGTVNSSGNYKIKINAQKKGTVLKVYAQDKSGNKSKNKTIKVT